MIPAKESCFALGGRPLFFGTALVASDDETAVVMDTVLALGGAMLAPELAWATFDDMLPLVEETIDDMAPGTAVGPPKS